MEIKGNQVFLSGDEVTVLNLKSPANYDVVSTEVQFRLHKAFKRRKIATSIIKEDHDMYSNAVRGEAHSDLAKLKAELPILQNMSEIIFAHEIELYSSQ